MSEFFRASQWPNTPDILTEFLQTSGRAAFAPFLLASTLGANYGIYGPAFELLRDRPLRPGSEEYLDSEKYQIRQWELGPDDSLTSTHRADEPDPSRESGAAERYEPALPNIDNDNMLAWSKRSSAGDNLVVVVVNLDIRNRQSGYVSLPLEEWGIPSGSPYQVHEMLTESQIFGMAPAISWNWIPRVPRRTFSRSGGDCEQNTPEIEYFL